jgi:hypothetical protein
VTLTEDQIQDRVYIRPIDRTYWADLDGELAGPFSTKREAERAVEASC